MGRFVRFEDREDKGVFPNSGEVSVVKGKVEEGGEEEETVGAKVFEMEVREVVGTESGGVFREFDGVGGVGDGERGVIGDEFEFVDGAIDAASEGALFVRRGRGILFVEEFGDGALFGEGFEAGRSGESDGLIGRLVGAFPGELA